MAGSRLDKIGNIFSRATGLLRSGVVKYEDRPIWYDVYRVFPPKYEPRYNREIDLSQFEVKEIFYEEDLVRAEFFKRFGLNPGGIVRNFSAHNVKDDCQRFINEYNSTKKENPSLTHEQVFDSVAKEFSITSYRPLRRLRGPRAPEGSLSASSLSSVDQAQELMDYDEEVETSNLAERKRGRKANIISAATLLQMFKEAKEETGSDPKTSSPAVKKTKEEDK